MNSEKLKIFFFCRYFSWPNYWLFDSGDDTESHDVKILTRFPENPILEILIKVAQICVGCFIIKVCLIAIHKVLSTYGNAHAKAKKIIFWSKFPGNWSEFTIFSIDFESSTNLAFDNESSSIGVENRKILGIQPIYDI